MTVQATFAATVVDEFVRAGMTDVVVCPGSRSTPMALAMAAEKRLRLHVRVDERSAGFVALGLATASRRPVAILTTSGTAAAELHPAVVEAWHGGHPVVVCTANRPPELHHIGAPQTIEQGRLFAGAVVRTFEPGVPDATASSSWRSLASRVVLDALDRPGPVHLDLAFRDPLVGRAGPLPPGRTGGAAWHRRTSAAPARSGRLSGRGLIVAGGGAPDAEDVHALARQLGWPVLADPRSGCRIPRHTTVAAADAILRSWQPDPGPEVVLHVGDPWASKIVNAWLAGLDAVHVILDPARRWVDPNRIGDVLLDALPTVAGDPASREWLAEWRDVESVAQTAIADTLAERPTSEPALARSLVASLAAGATLVVASSMPVHDVEWFMSPREGVRVVANRGANGIDGVLSTAVGVALADPAAPVTALLGDLAFIHDIGALAAGLPPNLDVVVVDNDGGGIFSFLPQAAELEGERFEQLFGTPHGLDLEAVAAGFGAGDRVRVVASQRDANVVAHGEIHAAVAAALAGRPTGGS